MGEAQPLVVVMYSKTEIVIVSNQGVKWGVKRGGLQSVFKGS